MSPILHDVSMPPGSSWTHEELGLQGGFSFEWHRHAEYELTFTTNSFGRRLIGDHVGTYGDGDLVLIGPDVPHSWRSEGAIDSAKPHVMVTCWFTRKWAEDLITLFPEMADVRALLSEAAQGVQFSSYTTSETRHTIEAIREATSPQRLILLLRILQTLSRDRQRTLLASPAMSCASPGAPRDARMKRVLEYLHSNYRQPISIEELADVACQSLSATQRLFRRHTGMTPIEYVTRLRIGKASSALMEGERSIAAVAELAGYNNLKNFHRQFRAVKGMNPSAFRALHNGRGGSVGLPAQYSI